MKCEQYRALIEEYVDGELNQQTAAGVDAHLSGCVECAALAASISREQQIYAGYVRDVEVTPQMWASVSARIQSEGRPPQSLLGRIRSGLKHGLIVPRFSPALAAALVLITIGATVGIMSYMQSSQTHREIAVKEGDKDRLGQSGTDSTKPPDVEPPKNEEDKQAQQLPPRQKPVKPAVRPRSTQPDPNRLIKEAEDKYIAAIKILTQDLKKRRPQLDPAIRARLDSELAEIDQTIYSTRQAVRQNPGDPIAFGYLLTAYSKKVDFLREAAAEN